MSLSEHEAMIQRLIRQPFKVPILNYVPEYSNKTLGMRKNIVRR
jgi:hypothetical protein